MAQENITLTNQEIRLIKHLKQRIMGPAAIQKSRARQKSRLTWLKLGDANTKYFHIMANIQKRNNFIYSLQPKMGPVTLQSEKHLVIFNHF
jgi:hypothetical protein